MLALKRFQPFHILRVLGLEWVEHRLVVARGVDAPLDAEPLDQPIKAETADTTPIEPTMEAGSAKISSAAQAIM